MKTVIFSLLFTLLAPGIASAQSVLVKETYVSEGQDGNFYGRYEVVFRPDGKVQLTKNGTDCEPGAPCAAVIKATETIIPTLIADDRPVDGALRLQLTPQVQIQYSYSRINPAGSWTLVETLQGAAPRHFSLTRTVEVVKLQKESTASAR